MQRKLYVTATRRHFLPEGSDAWLSPDRTLIRVDVEIRLPTPSAGIDFLRPPGIQVSPMVFTDTYGQVLVAMPPGVTINSTQEEVELGRIAASWVRAEIAKRGLEALTIGGPQWLGCLAIPEGAPHLHPDDPGDGVANMDWLG